MITKENTYYMYIDEDECLLFKTLKCDAIGSMEFVIVVYKTFIEDNAFIYSSGPHYRPNSIMDRDSKEVPESLLELYKEMYFAT